jgi:pimeloyl-ACP methyl ester carboxylesterase
MMQVVALPGGRAASYEVIGGGWPALMFAGGPGFSASYMNGDAELLSDVLCSYLIDPHGSGSSTPPADTADYSPEGHARLYEQVREALVLPEVVVLGHSFGATTALTYAALFPESTAMCVAVGRLRHWARRRCPAGRRGRGRGGSPAGPPRRVAVV